MKIRLGRGEFAILDSPFTAPIILSLAIFSLGIGGSEAWSQGVEEKPITEADREHWAFTPLVRPEVPVLSGDAAGRARNEIDHFVLKELEAAGLTLSPEADPATLIRRVTFDLTGLPPKPEDARAFELFPTDDRYAAYVQQLLDSPAYGERWAQHWLDLARFAETDGFEHDNTRPDAWRYRDWVIEALNRDLPYDEFVRLQIAGDELRPDEKSAALGTGFLLAGPDMPDINSQDERRHTKLNEITSTVGSVFLGLTMQCAQCHDHLYDPISQADFYRLRGFFDNAVHPKSGKSLGHVIREPSARPPVSFVYLRGDYRSPGPEIGPWFPRIANPAKHKPTPLLETAQGNTTGRRADFAKWLTREDNALFLRVSVNRLWQHHFVQPLVGTPNDFGRQGDEPLNQQLLDWLAAELPRQNWSLKAMHKMMVTSTVYRQSSLKINPADPDNRLMSRMNRRRLTGEALRDSMLAIGERLSAKAGGESVHLPLPAEVKITLLKKHIKETEDEAEHDRRSIYAFARRNLRHPMFDVYDRPDALQSCARRSESTTSTQSLTQLNSEFSREMATELATAIVEAVGADPSAWVDTAVWRVFGRAPTEAEYELAYAWLREQVGENRDSPIALADFCLALFNSNAFLYVD
ncbi:MAG: hypothetical protein ACI8UO_000859 [Verrucomicrobiales bacterium]